MKHNPWLLRSISAAAVAAVLLYGCDHGPQGHRPEGTSAEGIVRAMHDDSTVARTVADFMIKDPEGMHVLAGQLVQDPAAATRLFGMLTDKGGADMALGVACGRLEEWKRRQGTYPVTSPSADDARDVQKRP